MKGILRLQLFAGVVYSWQLPRTGSEVDSGGKLSWFCLGHSRMVWACPAFRAVRAFGHVGHVAQCCTLRSCFARCTLEIIARMFVICPHV